MPPRMENLVETDSFAVFSVDECVVLVWKQPPIMAAVDENRRLFQQLRTRHPQDKLSYLVVAETGVGIQMPSDVRAALAAMLREYQKAIVGSAIVFEGTGFRASIVRSVVAAINIASRLEFPSSVQSDLASAARWLVEKGGLRMSAADLVDAVRAFRARPGYLDRRTPPTG
jgi:hypothetical protein